MTSVVVQKKSAVSSGSTKKKAGASGEKKKVEETPRTVGEELYLVHLSRFSNPDPDDYDHDNMIVAKEDGKVIVKHHSKNVADDDGSGKETTKGEELWQVHCKRQQGCPDDDEEKEEGGVEKEEEGGGEKKKQDQPPPPSKKKKGDDEGGAKKKEEEPRQVRRLRNRTVP